MPRVSSPDILIILIESPLGAEVPLIGETVWFENTAPMSDWLDGVLSYEPDANGIFATQ